MSAARALAVAALGVVAPLAGCKENLLDDLPDAGAIDATDAAVLEGNFSCVDTPYSATAPDPLTIAGGIWLNGTPTGGISVEVRSVADDALVFAAVSDTTATDRMGRYSSNVTTAGVAPRLYRKALGTNGGLDNYHYDGIPVSTGYELWSGVYTDAATASYYQFLQVPRDPTKGTMFFHAYDCSVPPATTRTVAGVRAIAPPGAAVIYIDATGGLAPDRTETSTNGGILVLNVTPGLVDLELRAGPITYRSWPVRVYADSWTSGPRHP